MLLRYGLTSPADLAAAVMAMRDVVAAGGAHPLLSTWMASPATTTPDEQFELSLTFLLDGIGRRLPQGRR